MDKYIYTHEQYNKDTNFLAYILNKDKSKKHIVTLYRGGLPLGVALSNKTKSPLSILKFQRYDGNDKTISFMHCADILPDEKIIVVDDLVDEGETMDITYNYIAEKFPNNEIEVFTLFGRPGYDDKYLFLRPHPNAWIVFEPWE